MSRHGKKYLQVRDVVSGGKIFSLPEAIAFLKEHGYARFDETAEVALRLGVDPTKSDQMVRGTVHLPHGTGKPVRVVVFADGREAGAAREAGADEVGLAELIKRVGDGWTDFDVAVAVPAAMREVRKLGRILGPRGLMPNPKAGTLTEDVATAVKQFKAGRLEFKMDRHANVSVPFGKLSFPSEALVENCRAVIQAVKAARPAAAKGEFIRRCTVSSTMGPGLRIDPQEYAS
ncbi:MAG TPA: 50S ribosomal protein L1 [Kiritimatiellae bacterium]|nr:50S ribosomal protein L1 [Kiritimatiellia bacterium]